METLFGIAELPDGIIAGLLSGIIASGIVSFVTYRMAVGRSKKKLKEKFSLPAGEYNCYSFEKILPEIEDETSANFKRSIVPNGGKAEIVYENENILRITLRERDGYEWSGKILMQDETVGNIVWRYMNLPLQREKEWHWFGLKKLLVREEEHFVYLYLIGEVSEGFGNEVLMKKKLKVRNV